MGFSHWGFESFHPHPMVIQVAPKEALGELSRLVIAPGPDAASATGGGPGLCGGCINAEPPQIFTSSHEKTRSASEAEWHHPIGGCVMPMVIRLASTPGGSTGF